MNKPSSPEAKARGHDLLVQDTSSLAESSRGLGLTGCLRQDGCRIRERTAQAGSLAGSCDDRPDVTDQAAKDRELPGTRSLLPDWVLRARCGVRLPVFESQLTGSHSSRGFPAVGPLVCNPGQQQLRRHGAGEGRSTQRSPSHVQQTPNT